MSDHVYKIKRLEWIFVENHKGLPSGDPAYVAKSPIGEYVISPEDNHFYCSSWCDIGFDAYDWDECFDDLERAKAEGQAHFERMAMRLLDPVDEPAVAAIVRRQAERGVPRFDPLDNADSVL